MNEEVTQNQGIIDFSPSQASSALLTCGNAFANSAGLINDSGIQLRIYKN